MSYRESDFKIEQVHGRLASNPSREARVRNYIFGARSLIISHTKDTRTCIRIIGYEVPLYARGRSRDECIDLLGFDETFHPWIIELKIGRSSEPLASVVSQVNRYADAFDEGVRKAIQGEVRARLLWPTFSFRGAANKMILADRSFFARHRERPEKADDILFCSFSHYKDEETLVETPRAVVRARVEKRLTSESRRASFVGP